MPILFRAPRLSLVLALIAGLSPRDRPDRYRPAQSFRAPPERSAPEVDRSPWLFKGSDITPDLDWHFGTLPNGLRYAVRKNGVPPGQVSIRVRIDAGSLYEDDSEQGYAHFMEHLVFRGQPIRRR